MNKQINEAQIQQRWAPMLEEVGVTDDTRKNWVAKYAHFHSLNEDSMGGVTTPYATLYNVPGVGNAQPATTPATTQAQFGAAAAKGSGDKWPALLPMALQVAARTVGFDIVNVVPMPGPTGVVSYLDYVYAGGKQPFGAQPGTSGSENPNSTTTGRAVAPLAFKVQTDSSIAALVTAGTIAVGTGLTFVPDTTSLATIYAGTAQMTATYVGKSRIDGFSLFKTGTFTGTGVTNLSDIFDGAAAMFITDSSAINYAMDTYPTLISTLEDQVQGFTGAGGTDTDNWEGTFVSGTTLYEPMERGVGEDVYPRALGLQVFTKFIQVGTFQVNVSVTQEQIQDLNKQWGIDVIAMVENAGINEISQSINKHILSRLFSLGWRNHIDANTVEGINLNLRLDSSVAGTTTAFAYVNSAGTSTTGTMSMPGFQLYPIQATTGFENQDTVIKRVMANILGAGNVVAQRGRRGPANFIVTNLKMATALQTNAQYTFSPMANTFTQTNGSLYPLGTIAGMTVYVDPNMLYTDTRVLVGRKGASDEPGTVFCPYLMAESVKLITEGTGAPKVIIKSRYALVDAGFHPQTQYVTLWFETNSGMVI